MIGKFECTWSKDQSVVNLYLSGVRSMYYLIISVNTGDQLQAIICALALCAFPLCHKNCARVAAPDPP